MAMIVYYVGLTHFQKRKFHSKHMIKPQAHTPHEMGFLTEERIQSQDNLHDCVIEVAYAMRKSYVSTTTPQITIINFHIE